MKEQNFFYRDPQLDSVSTIKNYLKKDNGSYFYFRTSCLKMQERFAQVIDHSEMPKVFLHGNPHMDNYVKTDKGAAMIDFDRSRYGPYAWDIVRLLSSIALRKEKSGKKFLNDVVVDYLFEGYSRSFSYSELPFKQPTHLADINPEKWQKSVNDYLKSNNAWAKKLNDNEISATDSQMLGVFSSYLESLSNKDEILRIYQVTKAAKASGSMGNKRFLVLLSPENEEEFDSILLDIKSVYRDPDNQWYFNPFDHHGLRMVKAAELYAPGIEEMQGYATFNDEQFWGRAIPSFSYKIKEKLNETLQLDIAYSVGTQLGKAHRISLYKSEPAALLTHLEKNYKDYLRIAEELSKEIIDAHKLYVKSLKRAEIKLA